MARRRLLRVGVAGIEIAGRAAVFEKDGERFVRVECEPAFDDLPALLRVAEVRILDRGGADVIVALRNVDFVDFVHG